MILGICGSGRKEGSTGALVEEVLRAAGGPTELVWLIDLDIKYCTGCLRCAFEGACWQMDGMTGMYQKLIDADAIVYGSPCYYGNVSGLFKSFMDRSIALGYMGIGKEAEIAMHGRKPLAGKPAAVVSAVAGHGADSVLKILADYAGYAEMRLAGKLGAVVGMDDVRDKPEIMEQARELGFKLREALR